VTKKTAEEIELLKLAGGKLSTILKTLVKELKPGITTLEVDERAQELADKLSVEPVLLGYHPTFADRPYPAATCISINNCVQHGIPSSDIVIHDGDIVNLDMSVGYQGMVVDSGLTVGVGNISEEAGKLLACTKEALMIGIKQAKPGNRIGDISYAIQNFVESRGFSVVEVLCGHGVGYAVHEDPNIPNLGRPGTGPKIEAGHVYAIEPIVNIGKSDVYFDDDGDGYSVYTTDGSWSAHFEHSVVVTDKGPLILTK